MVSKVLFVDRRQVDGMPGWKNWAIISIGPNEKIAGIKLTRIGNTWSYVLRVQEDVTPLSARRIIDFVRSLPAEIDGIVVECHHLQIDGYTSFPVAKWITEELGIGLGDILKYNEKVYEIMNEAGKLEV